MKKLALGILLLSSYCYAQTADGFQPASTNVWGAEYPRVDTGGRAEFRIKAPNATAVKLNFWSNPKLDMVKGARWVLDRDHATACSRVPLLQLRHGRSGRE